MLCTVEFRIIVWYMEFTREKREKELPKINKVKEFSKVNFYELNSELEQVPWSVCSAFDDVNGSLWAYNKLYQNVKKDYIPERKVKVRHKSLPWINSEIRKLMDQRFAALNKHKRTKNGSDWNVYKKLRNKVTKQLKISETEYWKKSFKEAEGVKSFWSLVRRVSGTDKKDIRVGPIEVNKKIICKDIEVAEAMNDYFSSIGENLTKDITSMKEINIMEHIYRITPTINSVPLQHAEQIEELCGAVKLGKAGGHDKITSKEVKLLKRPLGLGLNGIVNGSIRMSSYPDMWKYAKVKSIFKKGSTADPGNYRSVPLLSLNRKIYEEIVATVIDKHIDTHNLSNPNQWGFRKGMSTETLLLYLTETWKAALDTNRVVGVIFTDFKKAFYTVNHKILSYKLQAVGISGDLYSLLLSYLENRAQYVKINGKRSKLRYVKVGVPQGSNLGSRLFAIYVNDFTAAIKNRGATHVCRRYNCICDIGIRRYGCRYLGKSS